MQADVAAQGGPPLTELRVDGGAAVNDTLMQFQADLLGVPVVRPCRPRARRWVRPIWPGWAQGCGRTRPR
jgi:glycerol kinase (EC 2.7.1.30)